MINLANLGTIITILTPLLGAAYPVIKMIRKRGEKNRKRMEYIERRLAQLQDELDALREDIYKDLKQAKENYKTEISFLSQKINELRAEITNQNGQIMTLLTNLISKE